MKKYETVMTWLKENIEAGRILPGEKLPTEPELMSRFGVSRNSVRQALGELSREKFVESRHGIGTFCIRRTSNRSMLVGLVCLRVNSYIFPRIIQGCNRVVQKNGFTLLINESWYDAAQERRMLLALREKQVDGIILTPVEADGATSNAGLVKEIEESGIAVVLLDNEYAGYNFSSVILDDHGAGRTAAQYLWDRGHRDIGMIFSRNYRPKVLRKDGALEYLREKQITVRPEWIVGIEGQVSPFRTYGQIRELFHMKAAVPTAVICSSDDEALMLIRQAKRAGINVPDDLSVISFDNSDLARFSHPRLTSMDHPSDYMGELAATTLLNRVYHAETLVRTRSVIDSAVVNRDSVLGLPPA